MRHSNYIIISSLIALFGLLLLLMLLFSGCGDIFRRGIKTGDDLYQDEMDGKGCEPTTGKCKGTALMLCNADHEWEVNTDCADFEPVYEYCNIDDIPGCYKEGKYK